MSAVVAVAKHDLLAATIEAARTRMEVIAAPGTKQKVHVLWAAAKHSRNLGEHEMVHGAFMALAIDTNLIDRRGYWISSDVRPSVRRHGAEDLAHAISWALRGSNPFETGALK